MSSTLAFTTTALAKTLHKDVTWQRISEPLWLGGVVPYFRSMSFSFQKVEHVAVLASYPEVGMNWATRKGLMDGHDNHYFQEKDVDKWLEYLVQCLSNFAAFSHSDAPKFHLYRSYAYVHGGKWYNRPESDYDTSVPGQEEYWPADGRWKYERVYTSPGMIYDFATDLGVNPRDITVVYKGQLERQMIENSGAIPIDADDFFKREFANHLVSNFQNE